MVEFVQYQDTTAQYYTDLMRKLVRMNSTLGFMLHYLDGMQSRIEGRLHMIQGYLGWAGTKRSSFKQAMCVFQIKFFTIGKTWVCSSVDTTSWVNIYHAGAATYINETNLAFKSVYPTQRAVKGSIVEKWYKLSFSRFPFVYRSKPGRHVHVCATRWLFTNGCRTVDLPA